MLIVFECVLYLLCPRINPQQHTEMKDIKGNKKRINCIPFISASNGNKRLYITTVPCSNAPTAANSLCIHTTAKRFNATRNATIPHKRRGYPKTFRSSAFVSIRLVICTIPTKIERSPDKRNDRYMVGI